MVEQYKSAVAIYLRKSRSDNASESIDDTLKRHNSILIEYAKKNSIYVTKTYKEVVSGDGLFTRPQMLKLLQYVEKGEYTSVMCVDIDRLGRSSTKESGIVLEILKRAHCRIITPEKTYDLENEVDEMTVELKSFFARQELRAIKKRLQRGELETLRNGGHTGEPPYGYKRIWIEKTPSLEPVKCESEVVKMIFEQYINGHCGAQRIAERLNKAGFISPSGGKFCRSTILHILSNPIYKGSIVWKIKGETTSVNKQFPYDDTKLINSTGLHKAIISSEIWDLAQEIRKSRAHPPSFTGNIKNPYAGLLYCAKCGGAMYRQLQTSGEERFICPSKSCSASIKASYIHARIKSALFEYVSTLTSEITLNENTVNHKYYNTEAVIKGHIKKLKIQYEHVHDFLEDGTYDIKTFNARCKKILELIAASECELRETNLFKDKNVVMKNTIPINEILKLWDIFSPTDKNKFLKSLISRITYKRESRSFKNIYFDTEIFWKI